MYHNVSPLFLTCQSPLHAGSGSDLGIVDLPIQREKHTHFPKIESSSLKGALREAFRENPQKIQLGENEAFAINNAEAMSLAFGPPSDGDKNAGALGFSDARILLFPVKSLRGIFTWITCPAVLNRFRQELQELCLPALDFMPDTEFENLIGTATDAELCINGKVTLEEFSIPVNTNQEATKTLAEKLKELTGNSALTKKLVVVGDDLFTFFVQYATAVITRVKIGETGTVEHGPFNEEYLPTETVLYGHLLASRVFAHEKDKGQFACSDSDRKAKVRESDKLNEYFRQGVPKIIQLGANASLAKGLLRVNTSQFTNQYLKNESHATTTS